MKTGLVLESGATRYNKKYAKAFYKKMYDLGIKDAKDNLEKLKKYLNK